MVRDFNNASFRHDGCKHPKESYGIWAMDFLMKSLTSKSLDTEIK